jgi:hypothetical protein
MTKQRKSISIVYIDKMIDDHMEGDSESDGEDGEGEDGEGKAKRPKMSPEEREQAPVKK